LGIGLKQAVGVTAVTAARGQERPVLRERDGVHLLEVTGRLPLRPPGRQAGAPDRVVVAAADDCAAVLREGNRGDTEVVACHDPARAVGPEVVEPYLLADPADE